MDTLTTLDSRSLREQVYRALRDALVSGELAPGQRLRDQDLAARLGVSRTPVREALQRLEDEGLVETTPRALTRVAPIDALAAREAFPVVMLRAADNGEITRTLERLTPKVRRLEYAQFGSLAGRKSVQQHAAIIAACERGDTSAAMLVEENWLTLGQLIAASLSDAADARNPDQESARRSS